MTNRSGAIESAVGPVLARCPDSYLPPLAEGLAGLRGASASAIRDLIERERRTRRRMSRAFSVMLPLFRPRDDGVAAVAFSMSPRPLWDEVSRRNPSLLGFLDEDDEVSVARTSERLCASAAAALRETPLLACGPEQAEALAGYFDLAGLLTPAARRIEVWAARPDDTQVAQLRLLLRDCAGLSSDGLTRAIDVLLAHLQDAALVLRLIVRGVDSAGGERFLAASELGVYVERLFDAAAERVRRLAPPATVEDIPALVGNLVWCGRVLTEIEDWVHTDPSSAWGARANAIRTDAGWFLAGLFAQCGPLLRRGLPMERVALAGHMTRTAPVLTAPADGPELQKLGPLLALTAQSRTCAAAFGCEAGRRQVLSDTIAALTRHADEMLERINAGDASDEQTALSLMDHIAYLLELADDVASARSVRRRRQVAARRLEPTVSPEAA